MMISKRQLKVLAVSVLGGSLFLSGCATKKFVREQVDLKVAPIDTKVTALGTAVKENAERIDAVDVRAKQGIADAATARTAAAAAQTTATQGVTNAATAQAAATGAQTTATGAQTAANTAQTTARGVDTRVTALTTVVNNVDRYVPGPVQKVMFKVGKWDLSDDAKRTLDGVAGPIASQATGYRVEIQGFASAEGKEDENIALSQARAAAVQRYLVSKGVPVIRISVLGVGPIGDKKDKKDEREANRRVEVRVFKVAS